MYIRKVKSTNGLILIRAEEASGEDDVRRIELESRAEPRPEFHEAMGGLIAPAMRMIQAPLPWITVATISGVSVTNEEERGMGAVVTLLVPLECAPSPLVINTPYLCSEDPDERGGPLLPTDLCKAVICVCDEAIRYLNGDRAQGDLFHAHVAGRPEHVLVDKFDEERAFEQLLRDGVVEELEPAHIVAGKLVEGSADLAEAMQEQSAAEPQPRQDGPRPQPGIKPARGRRAVKAKT